MFKQSDISKKLIKTLGFNLLLICFSSLLIACGNKGDLYLPEKGSVNETTTKEVKKKS